MKTKIIALSSLAILLGTGAYFGVQAQTPAPAAPARMKHERHPEMMRALKTLQRAKADLQKSSKDFGGHREKAADLTQQAINEVNAALQFDKN